MAERPRNIVVPQGEYTPKEIAKFLLYATCRSDDPDAKPGPWTIDPRQIPRLKLNLQLAIKTIRDVHDAGLFTGPNETAMFLAAYSIQQAAIASGKRCNDRTALKKLMAHMGFTERGGPYSSLCRKLKAHGRTLEQIAQPYVGTKRTT